MTDEQKQFDAREAQETIARLRSEVRLLRLAAKYNAPLVLWAMAQDIEGRGDSILDAAREADRKFLYRLTPEEQDMLLEGPPEELI